MRKTKPIIQGHGAPYLEWQTGQYERFARFSFILPYRFLLLCRLVETPPQKILEDFMAHLGCQNAGREDQHIAQKHLKYYFLANGYGQQYYTRREIHLLFTEMSAVSVLFPHDDEARMDDHVTWRDDHQHQWFENWFQKPRRLPGSHQPSSQCTIEQSQIGHQGIIKSGNPPSANSDQPPEVS